MGRDATVLCITKNLHPSKVICNAFKNLPMGHRLGGLTVKRMEKKKINQKDQLAIVVTHDDIKDLEGNLMELHASKRSLRVSQRNGAVQSGQRTGPGTGRSIRRHRHREGQGI